MPRSGKCRVLVQSGVVVAPEPPKPDTAGLRLAVGAPVWAEIAKSLAPVWALRIAEDDGVVRENRVNL